MNKHSNKRTDDENGVDIGVVQQLGPDGINVFLVVSNTAVRN